MSETLKTWTGVNPDSIINSELGIENTMSRSFVGVNPYDIAKIICKDLEIQTVGTKLACYVIELPLTITIPRKTKKDRSYSIGLNTYRNLNFIINNDLKKRYKEQIKFQLENLKFEQPIRIEYVIYPKTHRMYDGMNFASIASKFFLDSMKECGCILDDNYKIVKSESWRHGNVDKLNPRVEALIYFN